MALSETQLAALNRRINDSPEIQQALLANYQAPIHVLGNWGVHDAQGNQSWITDPVRHKALDAEELRAQKAFKTGAAPNFDSTQMRQPIDVVLKRYGIDLPEGHDYDIGRNPETGELTVNRHGFWERNQDWLVPALILGGGAVAGFAAPATAIPGAATAAAPGAAAPAAVAPVAGATAPGTIATVAGSTAPAVLSPLLDSSPTTPTSNTGFPGVNDGVNTSNDPFVPGTHPNIPSGSNVGNPPRGATLEDYLRNYNPSGNKSMADYIRDYFANGNNGGGNNGGVDTTGLLLGLGGSLISALGAVRPQQRQSFRGTKADPVNILSDATGAISQMNKPLRNAALDPAMLSGPQPLPDGTVGIRRNTGAPPSTQPFAPDEVDEFNSALSLLGRRR